MMPFGSSFLVRLTKCEVGFDTTASGCSARFGYTQLWGGPGRSRTPCALVGILRVRRVHQTEVYADPLLFVPKPIVGATVHTYLLV